MSSRKHDNRSAAVEPPPAALARRFQGWFAFAEQPKIAERRMGMIAVFALAGCLVEGLAIMQMLPLKEMVPYFVEADASGRVQISNKIATRFEASERHIKYFTTQWVNAAFTIDAARTREYLLPEANAFTRGAARDQLRTWLTQTDKTLDRLSENPLLRRDVKVSSISFVAPGVMIVRAVFSERKGTTGQVLPVETRKAITVNYGLLPTDKEEDINWNPIGFYITHFVVNDELA